MFKKSLFLILVSTTLMMGGCGQDDTTQVAPPPPPPIAPPPPPLPGPIPGPGPLPPPGGGQIIGVDCYCDWWSGCCFIIDQNGYEHNIPGRCRDFRRGNGWSIDINIQSGY